MNAREHNTNNNGHIKETLLEQMALKMTSYIGSPISLILHTIFFVGIFSLQNFGFGFDQIMLILTTIVSLEAIYLSIFIQITVNHQGKEIREVSEDVEEISEDVEEISKDIDDIQEDVEEISKDIDDIQEDVEEISEDIDDIQEDVEEISEDMEEEEKSAAAKHRKKRTENTDSTTPENKKIEKIEQTLEKLLHEVRSLQKT